MMRRSLLLIVLIFSLVTAGLYVTRQHSAAAASAAATKLATAQSVAAAQAQVGFHVRTAEQLPFAASSSLAMVKHLPQGVTAVDVEYAAGPRNYVRVTTMDHPVTQVSQYTLTKQALGNGQTATFLDNGAAQILTWTEGDMAFQIVAAKPAGAYTATELTAIADELK